MEYIEKRYQLEQEEGTIVGDDNLKVYITKYYKKNFLENLILIPLFWMKIELKIFRNCPRMRIAF
jgi:hypothetical protein